MTTAQAGVFSTLRPFGLPPTPILSLILTWGINAVATPRQYYGPILGKNNEDPASLLRRAENEKGAVPPEKLVKITRAKAAATNLAENMPLFIVASLVSWLAGVEPEYQNAYHIIWFLSRAAYKWAYLQGNGTLRSIFYNTAAIPTFAMLIHGGNLLAKKY
ncbi:hypothetical protein E1B28_002826 [Marasmius oreades]|uniref:Uncharacterized protein n=1 Tax=Marasmius oreades TaxID=181124 RepID=A0A9P7RPX6_9AGAR|nr:uncharacterized protein E1B28_002826 [Marasmius oreades]KAG7086908.1 hypothetical protein E1B28_002826 [Marasmius oreades]